MAGAGLLGLGYWGCDAFEQRLGGEEGKMSTDTHRGQQVCLVWQRSWREKPGKGEGAAEWHQHSVLCQQRGWQEDLLRWNPAFLEEGSF